MAWMLFGGLAAGATYLAGRLFFRRSHQESAAKASGLETAEDLSHLPPALQQSALWALADGGFERRLVTGKVAREAGDVTVTAFDLEALRERRGEWAYLPVEPPFRLAGVVSVVVCEVDRKFPHALFKCAGRGDDMNDDNAIEKATSVMKLGRVMLGMAHGYPAELPHALPTKPAALDVPTGWRCYTNAPDYVESLAPRGLVDGLSHANRRDLVVELVDRLVIVYPAARDVGGADAFADLTTTALTIVDGVLAASAGVTPRGIDVTTS